jgi:hypothetical protein
MDERPHPRAAQVVLSLARSGTSVLGAVLDGASAAPSSARRRRTSSQTLTCCVGVPAGVENTFAVRTPSATFLGFSLSTGMGAFFADLDASVPAGRPLAEVVPQLLDVTDRHGITFAR